MHHQASACKQHHSRASCLQPGVPLLPTHLSLLLFLNRRSTGRAPAAANKLDPAHHSHLLFPPSAPTGAVPAERDEPRNHKGLHPRHVPDQLGASRHQPAGPSRLPAAPCAGQCRGYQQQWRRQQQRGQRQRCTRRCCSPQRQWRRGGSGGGSGGGCSGGGSGGTRRRGRAAVASCALSCHAVRHGR